MIRNLFHCILSKYANKPIPRWAILIVDIFTLLCAFAVTDLFRLRYAHITDWHPLIIKAIYFSLLATGCYLIVGTHRGIIRHSGMHDVYKVLISNMLAAGILIFFNFINVDHSILVERFSPAYSEILTTFTLQIVIMLTVRLMGQRIYNDYVLEPRPTKNIILYGAGAAAEILINALNHDKETNYKVVGIIDDAKEKEDTAFQGIHVYAREKVFNKGFLQKHKVETLIIAIADITIDTKKRITNEALEFGLTVKAVPHISNWINNSFNVNQVQDIKIEDLLQRESIKLDNNNIAREVFGKVVMVTGAAGSIGSEICRQLIQYQPKKIIMLDQAESPMYDLQFELKNNEPYKQHVDRMEFIITNVKDSLRMEEVFSTHRPQIIYHAAAYKHVPFMEENVYEALFVNVFGTKIVADLALEYGAEKFVMISTDKAVNPTNVMGATKRMAEIYIQSRSTEKTQFVTTRFGNVLGSNGSVIPLFKKQLAAGGPLTVTDKRIIRYFMTIPEACNLVLEAGAMGEGGNIFVFDMGEPVKIYDLATKMIQLSGLKNIEIKEIGLRPGEKLYEELLATKENNIETHHPKIMRAEVRKYALEDIDRAYNELWKIMPTLDDMKLVAKMKEIVPEFKSNNSIYCQLDK